MSLERLSAARDISNAIYYLHSHAIVYRDLKPDNLGFDASGSLKLFDFGLAKRLDPMDKTDHDLYMLTGNTGSLRYMAPEVARGEPYDHRVDTYSFGILFWQICSLQTPYAGFSTKMHADKVVRSGLRPVVERSWPLSWVDLMSKCWDPILTNRLQFDEVAVFLENQVDELQNNEGEVPSRTSEIRAKQRKKKVSPNGRLDVDTRLATEDETTSKRFDTEMV